MKRVFQNFANYNRKANLDLISRFEKLQKVQLMQDTGAYYASIYEAIQHILMNSDTFFLKLFGDFFPADPVLTGNRLFGLDEAKYLALMEELELDYTKLFQFRKDADNLICRLVDQLSPEQFSSNVPLYQNEAGETVSGELWKTLLPLFDHQTYHRGQISAFLDRMGVENDSYTSGWGNKE